MFKLRNHPKMLGRSAFYMLQILKSTINTQFHKDELIDSHKPYLFAFWHGWQLLPSFEIAKHHFSPNCTMVSPSRDGTILATYLEKCGFEVMRGSSRSDNVRALLNIKKLIGKGYSIGFGVDGPIGPLFNVKPGIVYLSQKYDIPIIPVGSALNKKWILQKAWDKFQLPKPFAKGSLLLDTPYIVPKDISITDACDDLAQRLHTATEKAAKYLI